MSRIWKFDDVDKDSLACKIIFLSTEVDEKYYPDYLNPHVKKLMKLSKFKIYNIYLKIEAIYDLLKED